MSFISFLFANVGLTSIYYVLSPSVNVLISISNCLDCTNII
ncbi:hypothetical protein ACVXZZ_07400 [Staphylococcus aureus]